MKTKLFTLFLALVASVGIVFASVTIDGIAYNLNETELTVEVTSSGSYFGDVVIPSQISYEGNIYNVTSIGWSAFQYCSGLTSITMPNSVTSIGYEAFAYCWSLLSVTVPNSVTSIGEGAFYDCSSLTSPVYNAHVFAYMPTTYSGAYNISNGIETIIGGAFQECRNLTSITIPNSVTSIGEGAFLNCRSLTSITIPNSVIRIEEAAFYACTGLTTITIGSGVTSIGDQAFKYCNNITSVVWNAKNYTDDYGYHFGNQVTSFVFGDEVEVIPAGICEGMNKLTSITIPNSVTSIGNHAFHNCSGLTSVTIGDSVTRIGDNAFSGCSSLTSVTLNSNTIVSNTYLSDSNIKSIFGGQVEEYILGDEITSIGDYAFSDCSRLTSMTIPNSVTSIGDYAFSGCSGLTSITIPNSVTNIGNGAFNSCWDLTAVYISDIAAWCAISFGNSGSNPLRYAKHLYLNDNEITDLVITDGVTSIGKYAFYGFSGLTSATIPNSATSIGEYAFSSCSNLTSVNIGDGVTSIGDGAFDNCSSLTSIGIGSSVASIGWGAFDYCNSLAAVYISDIAAWCAISFDGSQSNPLNFAKHLYLNDTEITDLVIPDGVTSIGKYAFYGCSGLISATIPNSATSIGERAFNGCSGLTSVTIGNGVTNIGNSAFYGCSSLTSLAIPNSVTSIGDYAFSRCSINEIHFMGSLNDWLDKLWIPDQISSNYALHIGDTLLSSVVIPKETTSIADHAFDGCNSIESVVLGGAVKTIGDLAFNCPNIKSITCYSMRPPSVHQNGSKYTSFPEDMPYSTIIYVPANYKNTYMVHDFWGMYDVRPIGADTTETTSVQVTSGETTATVVWPTVNGAETYELVIKDKQGNVICTLIFNSNGQLTEIAFNAPSRNQAPEQTQTAGFSFTVTGLEKGTAYDLTLTSKDSNGATLDQQTIAFSTTVGTGIEDIPSNGVQSTKIIRNGQVLILREGKTYTVEGQEVK